MALIHMTKQAHLADFQRVMQAKVVAIALKTAQPEPANPWRSPMRWIQVATREDIFIIDAGSVDCRDAMVPLLEDPNILKVFHHAKFAARHFLQRWNAAPRPLFCTYHAGQLLAMGRRGFQHRLRDLAERFLQSSPEPTWELLWERDEIDEDLIQAAADEAELLLDLHQAMNAAIATHKLKRVTSLEFRTVVPVAAMELRGIFVDRERLKPLTTSLQAELDALETEVKQHLRDPESLFEDESFLNLHSPKQLLPALQRAGVEVRDTSEHQLRPYLDKHPWLKSLLAYRHRSIVLNTLHQLEQAIAPETGRVHATYHQIASPSGRFACSDPNIQQVPREAEVRSCIRPEPGYRYVMADYSQVELRVAAGLSQAPVMMEAYRNGEDLHRLTAALTMGKQPDQVTSSERQAAKAINFGLIYAMGAAGLQASAKNSYGVALSMEEATTFRDRFFQNYHGIARWQQRLGEEGRRRGYVRTAGGRLRSYQGEKMRITEMLNTPVQGTAAEGLKSALCIFWDKVKAAELDAAIVAIIHDEIIVEVREDQAERAKEVLVASMTEGIAWLVPGVPFVADAALASSWAEK